MILDMFSDYVIATVVQGHAFQSISEGRRGEQGAKGGSWSWKGSISPKRLSITSACSLREKCLKHPLTLQATHTSALGCKFESQKLCQYEDASI